jgi:hypothetical protein
MRTRFFLILLFGFFKSYGVTYYTVANGAWGGAIWATCSTCTGATLPTLNDDDILVIDDRVTIASGTITIAAKITIQITTDNSPNTTTSPAKLIFTTGGKLALSNAGSSVVLINISDSGADPMIDGSGSGGSNTITIGGTEYWRASDGDLQGTGTLQPGPTLPVRILSFDGAHADENVMITWVTTMEQAFSHYVILHSANGITYDSVGSVPGNGADISGMEITYTYLHQFAVLGLNYYKLQAVDLDGHAEYFGPIAVKLEADKHFSVYPNPSTGRTIKVKRNFDGGENDQIVVINQYGQDVFSAFAAYIEDELTLTEGLPVGIYIVKYVGEGVEFSSYLIVTN